MGTEEECGREDSASVSEKGAERSGKKLPRINFRVFLFCALGIAFGIFLYTKIRFGGIAVSDFLFIAFFLFAALQPWSKKRILAALVCFLFFAAVGVIGIHIYSQIYLSGAKEGEYRVEGVVVSESDSIGYSTAVLDGLTFNGRGYAGKMRVHINGGEVQIGDVLSFDANVSRCRLPHGTTYSEYCFASDIRYETSSVTAAVEGRTGNPLLLVKRALFGTLHAALGRDEADLSYALLTGDSGNMDAGLKEAVQKGGIAHIFAVSGLHIGIVYAAVSRVSKRLGRYSFLPAFGAALLYSAFCAFTVSSVRAVIMCGALGFNRALGRKTDLLQSLSLAAVIVLIFLPAQWLSAGFRLSFGAVLGLALFSGSLSRAMKKWKFPAFLSEYLAASVSVQLSTFPVLLDCFHYFPVWGFLLNFFLLPVLPVLFLALLLCSVFAMIIPPAAGVFLFLPNALVSLLPFLFAATDTSFVLTGFSLGAGGVVWLTGAAALSERLRLKPLLRGVAAGVLCVLFSLCVVFENVVTGGCRIRVEGNGNEAGAALVQTPSVSVLVLSGEISLKRCEDFLAAHYGGRLDGVVVLSDAELDGINVGAFLPAAAVYARDEIPTGLQKTNVVFGESFRIGGLQFRYESREKLFLVAQGRVVEFDFTASSPLGGDLFVEKGSGGLKYSLKNGIIESGNNFLF